MYFNVHLIEMAGGNSFLGHSNKNENDANDDKGTESSFDEARENPNSNLPSKLITSITTGSKQDLAKEEETGMRHHLSTLKAEQRANFLGNLAYLGVGTNRVEMNQVRSRNELRCDTGRRVGDIVAEMERKESDAKKEAGLLRHQRNVWKRKVQEREDLSRGQVKKMLKRIHKKSEEVRKEIKEKHAKAESFKVKK